MLDFPGPGGLTVGQVFTSAGKSWQWDGAKWGPAAGGGAPLDSPSFTGDPKAPTPATADNDTSIATTAFVKAQGYLLNNQLITLSGDIAGSGASAITATLATVNSNVGTFAIQTVNAKGLVTAAANMTGDVTTSGGAATLATVNSNVGTFQGLTLDAKGRVTAAANQNYVTGGPYLPTAGGTMTGNIDVPNNVAAFRGKETGGTARNLAWMGSDNHIYIGDGNNSINLFSNGTVTLTSPIDLQNNNALRCKDTGGTLHQALMLSSDNNFYVGDGSRNIIVNTGVSPNQLWATGGASKPGGGVWADNSDARLKRNVIDYRPDDALAAILQLRPVQFEFNGLAGTPDDGKTFVGLVADEVEPVMPEMVSTREAFLRADDAAPVDVKVLDCTALLFTLVNAVKDLSAQISELQARPG